MKAKRKANRACTQLSNSVGFSLAFIVLLNKFVHVHAVSTYISEIQSSNSDTNSNEDVLSKCNENIHNGAEIAASATNRTRKFLFDTLFNINTPLADDDSEDDDDDVKTCNCGENNHNKS